MMTRITHRRHHSIRTNRNDTISICQGYRLCTEYPQHGRIR